MRASAARKPARQPARIELDRVLVEMGEIEDASEPLGEVDKDVAAEDRGSAAAPVQMDDAPSADGGAQQVHLFAQKIGIGRDRRRLAHRLGGAAAIEAELAAIGDMQIERQRRLRRQRREPRRVSLRPHIGGEMRRGRIGRVARHRALGEGQGRAHASKLEALGSRGVDRDQIGAQRARIGTAHDKLAVWLGNPCGTGLTLALRFRAGIASGRRSGLFPVNESRLRSNPRSDRLRGVSRARRWND